LELTQANRCASPVPDDEPDCHNSDGCIAEVQQQTARKGNLCNWAEKQRSSHECDRQCGRTQLQEKKATQRRNREQPDFNGRKMKLESDDKQDNACPAEPINAIRWPRITCSWPRTPWMQDDA
jgi:hypothetical protein